MELTAILTTFRKTKSSIFLVFLAIFLCSCIVSLLLVASIVLFVVIFPLLLLFGAPVQFSVFLFNILGICTRRLTAILIPQVDDNERISRPRTKKYLRVPGDVSEFSSLYDSSPRIEELSVDEDAPDNANITRVEHNEYSNTVEQFRSALTVSTDLNSPNVLGVSLFVDSPIDYRFINGASAKYPSSLFRSLPQTILEEILRYLPAETTGTLALVSRSFGSQFRFRRVHSGTEFVPLLTFSLIARKPQLGEHVLRLIIHPTYYRPHMKVQWLLEGSDPAVSQANWTSVEDKKLILLSAVIQACRRVYYLTWNEGRLPMPPHILNTIQIRLATTLRNLDIHADGTQLLAHLRKTSSDEFDALRLVSLTIRGGLNETTIPDILRLLKSTRNSLRYLTFIDSRLGTANERLADMLKEYTDLKRIEFINTAELDTSQIPIAFLGRQRTLNVLISHPITSFKPFPLAFCISPSQSLTHLTSLILTFTSYREVADLHIPNRSPGHVALFEVVAAAVNLRVLACNSPTVDRRVGLYYDPRMEVAVPSLVPYDLIEALITKKRLVSLSLMSWTMGQNQLRMICQRLPQLLHLAVYMPGEGRDISQYSSQFSRLQSLIALDVTISPFDTTCPCGHELDARIPHTPEGTAMGRLCRRVRQPTSLKIVRLSQNGWFSDTGANDHHTRWIYEINWIESPELVVEEFEKICGPFCNENEVVRSIFNPLTWVSVG